MSPKINSLLIALLLLLHFTNMSAQDRFAVLEEKLNVLAKTNPGYNEKIDISVNGISIQEFIRGIAAANDLNMVVDASLNISVVNNFSNVPVIEVLSFIARKYDLDISFVGS